MKTYLLIVIIIFICPLSAQTDKIRNIDWDLKDSLTVRLSPDEFPYLPDEIKEYLKDRDYTIPQSWAKSMPHNVISGEFKKNGQVDYAVLASKNRVSSIIIFWNSSTAEISKIAEFPDKTHLQYLHDEEQWFSRYISTAPAQSVRYYYERAVQDESYGEVESGIDITHDGIEDVFLSKASVIFYMVSGNWMRMIAAD